MMVDTTTTTPTTNTTVLTRTKSKRSDHGKVKKLKKAITRRFNSKSYETISLSKKDDVKKNVITFIHSNGLIQSDVNVKNNKIHHVNTHDKMNKGDKKRDLILNNNKTRRFSLPSPEILKELQCHKSKLSSSHLTIESLKSFPTNLKEGIHSSHSIKKTSNTPTSKPLTKTTTTSPINNNNNNNNSNSNNSNSNNSNNNNSNSNNSNNSNNSTNNNSNNNNSNNNNSNNNNSNSNSNNVRRHNSVKHNTSSKSISLQKTTKSPRPKSKLSKSITLPVAPSPPPLDNKPSAPSLNEMYLEEVKDHQKFLQYKNLINSEQGKVIDEGVKTNPSSLSSPPPLIPSPIQKSSSSSVRIQNPFEPPFTTLSPSMTTVATTTTPSIPVRSMASASKSPFNETLSHLPKPSSLSFYTQSPSNFDSVPPKIHDTGNGGKDYSIEKVTPKIDLVSRRDSLDFYFDKLCQPSKSMSSSSFSSSSSTGSNSSSHLSYPGPTYTSLEPDIPSLEVSQHRMMAEPQPTYYNVAHSNFNRVMKDTFNLRTKLEDKVEETKFQMMIAITQLNLINEQLDILNCNNLK
ncbi:hypothetical protein PIROE2DRAFT_2816 [Piromyces sp. E2]|nr:hypothetical protein PIROE2DRAFT_2816 [Piromyces sp. E2]|eukprot:OUM69313.1 hypothetical protein PIROE2DRAFT_2816 [Piromyces sp. E2]